MPPVRDAPNLGYVDALNLSPHRGQVTMIVPFPEGILSFEPHLLHPMILCASSSSMRLLSKPMTVSPSMRRAGTPWMFMLKSSVLASASRVISFSMYRMPRCERNSFAVLQCGQVGEV